MGFQTHADSDRRLGSEESGERIRKDHSNILPIILDKLTVGWAQMMVIDSMDCKHTHVFRLTDRSVTTWPFPTHYTMHSDTALSYIFYMICLAWTLRHLLLDQSSGSLLGIDQDRCWHMERDPRSAYKRLSSPLLPLRGWARHRSFPASDGLNP